MIIGDKGIVLQYLYLITLVSKLKDTHKMFCRRTHNIFGIGSIFDPIITWLFIYLNQSNWTGKKFMQNKRWGKGEGDNKHKMMRKKAHSMLPFRSNVPNVAWRNCVIYIVFVFFWFFLHLILYSVYKTNHSQCATMFIQ